MITTDNPYNRKVGLNISNNFFKLVNKDSMKYLDLVFRENEREAIGRRILIAIYLLEGYSGLEIMDKVKCGRQTITSVNKSIKKSEVDKEKLLKFLVKVYYEQFPKTKNKYSGGSRTVSGTKKIIGIAKEKEEFVPLYT